ncbi:MAG: hypothetical protein JSV17_00255 [Candidatus Aminicenantes bacterium]|nr:MAG: hypothetical protein JSV17_00255 [Candidatus Aminicenantes bacterium]
MFNPNDIVYLVRQQGKHKMEQKMRQQFLFPIFSIFFLSIMLAIGIATTADGDPTLGLTFTAKTPILNFSMNQNPKILCHRD